MDNTLTIGHSAEQIALDYLKNQGCKLLQKNFRCKLGEIDLIVKDDDAVVFTEVRYRFNESFGSGAETVTPSKQRKIIKTAQYYLRIGKINYLTPCRFDVISITLDNNKKTKIDWIKDAFQLN